MQPILLILILPSLLFSDTTSLKELAKQHGLLVGSYAYHKFWQEDPEYARTLEKHFSLITAGVYFPWTEPEENKFHFNDIDYLLESAKKNSMKVRIHPLVWGNPAGLDEPKWVLENENKPERLNQILKNHIQTIIRHTSKSYKDGIIAYDVVNEPLENLGYTVRKSIWSKIHPDNQELYIHDAFRYAHEADPTAKLFLNECFIERDDKKFAAFVGLLKSLLAHHVPVHGVGIQMHQFLPVFSNFTFPLPGQGMMLAASGKKIKERIAVLSALGLEVHLTEMDIPIWDKGLLNYQLQEQKKLYRSYYQACLSEKSCKAIVVWGVTDKESWIPQFFPGFWKPLLFDENFLPKPAFEGVVDALKSNITD